MKVNAKSAENLFSCRILAIKLAAKYVQSASFLAILLVSVMIVGIFSLSPAISTLMNSVIIGNTGEISTGAYATSGSAEDIQVAVDWVVANGGIGNVYIPNGTFDFVEVGEPWLTVNIPAGVNLFGAPTERDANGQVVEWKTILIMPWDVPGTLGGIEPFWFKAAGSGDPDKPFRFSDIKLVGYRSIDPSSTTISKGIHIKNVMDFRVDHCCFEHICGGGVVKFGTNCRGLVDHSSFVNTYGHVESDWASCTVNYGVQVDREYGDVWEDDVVQVLGKYTNYSVYIEDCYFEKWRHCIAGGNGAHYVIRNSTIKDDFGFGSLDAHGWGVWDGTKVTRVGTRAVEIYNCEIVDAIQSSWATMIRGGGGVAYNNTVGGGTYNSFIYFSNEADPEVSKCWCHDWWIWNNTLLPGVDEIIEYDPEGNINEGEDYFRYAPHTFNYEPYPYPHPLTLED